MQHIGFENAMRLNKRLNELIGKGQNKVNKEQLKAILKDAESRNDPIDAAAVYFYRINRDHPFYGANKRSGFMLADIFLQNQGILLDWDKEDAYHIAMEVRAGRIPFDDLKVIIKAHIAKKKKIRV